MKNVIKLLVFFLIVNANAQNQERANIDSLVQELHKSKDDTNKVNLLLSITKYYNYTDLDSAYMYAEHALKLGQELNWKYGIASSHRNIGTIYWLKSDYPEALNCNFNALKIFEEIGDKFGILKCLGGIGMVYYNQSDYPKALDYYNKSLKISYEIYDKYSIASNLSNIGLVYMNQSKLSNATDYYLKSLKYFKELNEQNAIASNYGYLSQIYFMKSDYSKALDFSFKALEITKLTGDKRGIVINLGSLSEIYLKLSQDSVFSKIDIKDEFVGTTRDENLKLGLKYLNDAINLSKEIGDLRSLVVGYLQLYEVNKNIGNYKIALKNYENYKKYQDSVYNLEKAEKLSKLEAERETLLKERELKIRDDQILIQKLEIERKDNLLLFQIVLFLLIILISLLILYYLYKRQRKAKELKEKIEKQKVDDAIRESEIKFRSIFNNISEGIFQITLEGVLLNINPAFARITGYKSPDEMMIETKQSISNVYENIDDRIYILEHLNKNDFVENFELKLKKKDSSLIWVVLNVHSVKDTNGVFCYNEGTVRDISERKHFEEILIKSENKFRTAFMTGMSGVVIVGRDNGLILEVNERMTELYGYSREELIGHTSYELGLWTYPEDRKSMLSQLNKYGKVVNMEVNAKRKDGTTFWVLYSVNELNIEDEPLLLGAILDINERKIAEEELISAKEHAEESDNLKTAFLQNISHEIRTPLNGIIGFSSLLTTKDLPDNEVVEYRVALKTSINRLLNIINDLLDISRLETKQIDNSKDTFLLTELIESLFIQYEGSIVDKGLIFEINILEKDYDYLLYSDSKIISKVLNCFLSNALKFTSIGKIEIGFYIANQSISFFVRDTGIGLTKDSINRIFDKFYQVDLSISRSYEGAGLGLSIAKGLSDLIGGKIWVESELGEGSTFYLTLDNLNETNQNAE